MMVSPLLFLLNLMLNSPGPATTLPDPGLPKPAPLPQPATLPELEELLLLLLSLPLTAGIVAGAGVAESDAVAARAAAFICCNSRGRGPARGVPSTSDIDRAQ